MHCASDEICNNNDCQELPCTGCSYASYHQCNDAKCCAHTDCDDSDPETEDSCLNPKSAQSRCQFVKINECSIDSDCDDEIATTKDICAGSPKNCSHINITDCRSDDDFCPPGCAHVNDTDCDSPLDACGFDDICWDNALKNCERATYGGDVGSQITFEIEIVKKTTTKCHIRHRMIKNPVPEFEDTYYDCEIPRLGLNQNTYETWIQNNLLSECEGTYIDAINAIDFEDCDTVNLTVGVAYTHQGKVMVVTGIGSGDEVSININEQYGVIPLDEERIVNGIRIRNMAASGNVAELGIDCI